MPKKSEPQAEPQTAEVKETLQSFSFPTIGNGISIQAKSFDEALEIANKIKAGLDSIS